MSRGPGVKQRYLMAVLERMPEGFYLQDLCSKRKNGKAEYQAYWRALKTSGLPYWKIEGEDIWVGDGKSVVERHHPPSIGDSRNPFHKRENRRRFHEYYDALKAYRKRLEEVLASLNDDSIVSTASQLGRHISVDPIFST